MKKFTLALVAVLSAILMCFGMAACSSSVAGNTYVFDDVKVTLSDDAPEGAQDMVDQAVESIKAMYASVEITFNEDGTCEQKAMGMSETGYYVQDGSTIYMYGSKEEAEAGNKDDAESTATVSGSKIKMTMEEGGMKATITFKKK